MANAGGGRGKSLDTLSRLKGIETTWGSQSNWVVSRFPLDTLSRLKGIETFPCFSNINVDDQETKDFGYAFPFEGNWNNRCYLVALKIRLDALDTLSRLKGIETILIRLNGVATCIRCFGYAFPFEGNWNSSIMIATRESNFGYAFPFEGNWNIIVSHPFASNSSIAYSLWIRFPVWRELKLKTEMWKNSIFMPLDTFSRLKGIETYKCHNYPWTALLCTLDTLSRLKGIETITS